MPRVCGCRSEGLLRRRCRLQGLRVVHQRQPPDTTFRIERRGVIIGTSLIHRIGDHHHGGCAFIEKRRPRRSGGCGDSVDDSLGLTGSPKSMRVVIQRVGGARVDVDGETVGQVGRGVLLLVGVTHGDTATHAEWVARRTAELRIFADADGKMNRSLADTGGGALVVSQFTLYADTSQGRRPSYVEAARAEFAAPLVEAVAEGLRERGVTVATGRFGAHMDLFIQGDGPVTIILDTADVPAFARV